MKFDKNYNHTLSEMLATEIPTNEWSDIVKTSSMYSFLKNNELLNNAFKNHHRIQPLLVSILKCIFNPRSETASTQLMQDFGVFIKNNYPQIDFLNPIGKWKSSNNSNIKSIVAWYYKQNFEPYQLECSECSGLMIPSFVRSGRYCCIDDECKAFNIPIYENHCWNCLDDVSSLTNYECSTCNWIICNKCSSCTDPRYGSCSCQIPNDTKIKYEIIYNDYSEGDFLFESKYIDKIYNNSLKNFSSINNSNFNKINCNRGKEIIQSDESLNNYLALYLPIHVAKLYQLFQGTDISGFQEKNITLIDWGCGTGLGTISLFEYLTSLSDVNLNIKNVVLIEPSDLAIQKAGRLIEDTDYFKNNDSALIKINKKFDELNSNEILHSNEQTIHIMSNIIDLDNFDIELMVKNIKLNKNNLIFCITPGYKKARHNLNEFFNYFNSSNVNQLHMIKQPSLIKAYDFKMQRHHNKRYYQYSKSFFVN